MAKKGLMAVVLVHIRMRGLIGELQGLKMGTKRDA